MPTGATSKSGRASSVASDQPLPPFPDLHVSNTGLKDCPTCEMDLRVLGSYKLSFQAHVSPLLFSALVWPSSSGEVSLTISHPTWFLETLSNSRALSSPLTSSLGPRFA